MQAVSIEKENLYDMCHSELPGAFSSITYIVLHLLVCLSIHKRTEIDTFGLLAAWFDSVSHST